MISAISNMYFLSTLTGGNYALQNMNNIFNFLISLMGRADDSERKRIINDIKLFIGMSFFESFKQYAYRKLNINNEILMSLS